MKRKIALLFVAPALIVSLRGRVFAGQQRGGLKCVSGICKVFPAYSGARVELTVRF